MKLEFVGKDPASNGDHSPTIYRCAERASWVVQGWKVDPSVLASLDIPDNEDAVEIPFRMLPYLNRGAH